MAFRSSRRSRTVAICLVALMLVVAAALQPASAARPLRPAGWNAPSSDGKGHAAAAGVVDKYAPLLLAMLPRGSVTPSGPSGGTNGDGN
ncbi:hypothetical protein E2562_032478 [Oryza meyeriana var. granulata]|uniref:Uncharacterized protein n=1 Tax=Oryza meyeriana var. granulata TaxID=110450 RepID=A0A6G1ES45_9ORYZ|nr:hypothetical protein E2562_032478 [Oryza meyeriana var. granulata]